MEQMTLDRELLNKDLEEYFNLKAQKEEIEDKMKPINAKIVQALEEMGEKKYSSGEYQASVSYSEKIKYVDDKALIELLKKDATLKSYVIETINTKELNKLIKSSPSVEKKLHESYTKTNQSSLTVTKL